MDLRLATLALLDLHGIPYVEQWGQGRAKNIAHLLDEIEEGECTLVIGRGGKLTRVLDVVLMRIYCKNMVLVERERAFKDGRDISRSLDGSLAEKMTQGETCREAAIRALSEELGVHLQPFEHDLLVHTNTYRKLLESVSFPGLLTERIVRTVDFTMPEKYVHEKYCEVQDDKVTTFAWIPWSERPWK